MTCQRCGQPDAVGLQVDTMTVRVNEVAEVFRLRLCRGCRSVLTTAIRRAVEPVGAAAA